MNQPSLIMIDDVSVTLKDDGETEENEEEETTTKQRQYKMMKAVPKTGRASFSILGRVEEDSRETIEI